MLAINGYTHRSGTLSKVSVNNFLSRVLKYSTVPTTRRISLGIVVLVTVLVFFLNAVFQLGC